MTKRILAMVLAVTLVFSLLPAVVLAEDTAVTASPKAGTHTGAGHSDDCGVTTGWQAWEKADSLPTSGSWYLAQNVTLTAEHTITGSLDLCLNGYVIKQTAGTRVMGTKNATNMTVRICDCTAYEENGTYYAGAITGGNDLTATGGGAIFARRGSMLHIYDGRITGNKTQTAGGALLSQAAGSGYAASNIYIYGGELSNNLAMKGTAYVPGGAVYLQSGSAMEISGGLFQSNKGKDGGVVYAINNTVKITGGVFRDNEASNCGGVIYSKKNTVTISGAAFTGNYAKVSGSVLHDEGGTKLTIGDGTEITGNTGANTNPADGLSAAVCLCGSDSKLTLTGKVVIASNSTAAGVASVNMNKAASDTLYVSELAAGSYVEFCTPKTVPAAASEVVAVSGSQSSWTSGWLAHMDSAGKLQYVGYENGEFVFAAGHVHTLCNDLGCTEHTAYTAFEAWGDDPEEKGKLPASGSWYLADDITVTAENQIKTATTLNLCLNGKTVTGGTGKGLRAYSTTANVATVINICDCTAREENGEYKAGKFTGFVNTHDNSGGGCIYIRKGGTLNFYDGIIENCVSATGGAAIYLLGATATIWNGKLTGNSTVYNNTWKHGGAIYADGSALTMYDGQISDNLADWGGGIYFANGTCSFDMRGGEISGNTARTNGGGIVAHYSAMVLKLSGDAVIFGNSLQKGDANNVRLGSSAIMTIGQLEAGAKVGFNATAGRAVSNALSSDLSSQFPSDDPVYTTYLNESNKLQLKETPVITHKHGLCNDTGCTDHTEEIAYKAWTDATSLPASGSWYLDTDVTITKEVSVTGSLDLCLNGHKVTGSTGKGLHFYTTPGKGGEVLNISDCTAKTENGVYTAGGFYNNTNTHTGTGGGAIYIRAGGTLNFFEGIVSGNTTATGGGAFYLKNATATFYNGLLEKNTAGYEGKWYDGGALYLDNANVTIYNTGITGNEARNGGGVYMAGSCQLDVRGGSITGNTAHTGGGGVYAISKSTAVKLSGKPVITGNQLDGGKASNLCLAANGLVQVSQLEQQASIGVTADAFRAFSGKTQDYTANFFSDDTRLQVIYQDEALYMGASGNHKHCLCQRTLTEGCDHSQLTFVEWDDPTSLPASGNYYLGVDVVVSAQTRLEGVTLNLCLNGHTVKVGDQGGRVYYMTTDAKLNITDCAGGGKFTGATAGAVLTDKNGKDMVLNLYAGSFTGNHTKDSGGALVIQGECTFNMYGGKITGNSAKSSLKTDDQGNVLLDKDGNQSFRSANGGGVYLANGTFNMYGGEISKNETTEIGYLKAGAETETVTGGVGGGVHATAAAKVNLYGGRISENKAYNGGGLFLSGADSELYLMGGEISGNRAGNGAGVLTQTHAVTYMSGGKISGNRATISGAGVYVSTGTKFTMTGGEVCQNVAAEGSTRKNGGGFFLLSSTLELSGGKIWGNKAAGGAGIFTTATMSGDTPRSTYIYIKEGALITENEASGNGGGIMFNGIGAMTTGEHSKLIMTGGEISKNTAKNAAGILVQTKTAMEMSGGKVTGNRATDGGGGIYASTGTKFTMTGGTITGNFAKNGGGGLFLLRATGIIKSGNISYNSAGNGGGIKNNGSRLDIYSLTIVGNDAIGTTDAKGKYTAGNAGGLWAGRAGYQKDGVQLYDAPVINIYNMYLADSTATGAAGGILIQSQNTIFNMYGGTVTGNSTEENTGGGLYLSTNVKANITGGTFSNNTAWNSAAIHVGGNNAQLSNVIIRDNEALNTAAVTVTGKTTNATMKNVQFLNNVGGGHVGALVVQGYATLNLEDSRISGNSAGGMGGGVFFSSPGYGFFKNVEISENTAKSQAGGVYVGNNSDVLFENVTIRDNVAEKDMGGGISTRGRLVMRDCKILNNEVKDGVGGAIATAKLASELLGDEGGVYAENCVISGNKATGCGGAINAHRGHPVYLTDCTITDNSSFVEGGAIYADGRISMENVTVTGNVSGGEGYAVYLTPSNFDGHSYQSGHKRIAGDMVIRDNPGGDLYLSNGTILAVTGERLGEKSYVVLTLAEGVLSQWVFGVYSYEGGDGEYVLTGGDRSITDPEPYGQSQETEAASDKSDDILLYVGIGVIALAVCAAVVIILKKKKTGKAAGSSKE